MGPVQLVAFVGRYDRMLWTGRPRVLVAMVALAAGIPVAIVAGEDLANPAPNPDSSGRFAVTQEACASAPACLRNGAAKLEVPSLGLPVSATPFRFVSGEILSSAAEGTTVHLDYAAASSSVTLSIVRRSMVCQSSPPAEELTTSPAGRSYCQVETPALLGAWVQRGPLHYTLLLGSADPTLLALAVDSLTP